MFGPGEALHCTGLLGELATNATATLRSMGLTAEWAGANVARHGPTPAQYINGGTAESQTTMLLTVSPELPNTRAYQRITAHDNRGCPPRR